MRSDSPRKYYEQEQTKTGEQLNTVRSTVLTVSRLRIFSILAGIAAGYFYYTGSLPGWAVIGCVVIFFVLVRRHIALSAQQKLLQIRLHLIEHELKALEGDYTKFAPGDEFINTGHPYSFDLDVFGKGSVFQALNRSITASGYQLLAHWLQHPLYSVSGIGQRQAIFKELATQPDLLLQLRTIGAQTTEKEDQKKKLEEWLQAPPEYMENRLIVTVAILMPVISIAGIIWSVIAGTVHPLLTEAIFVNGLIWAFCQQKIKRTNIQIGHSAEFVEKYEGLLQTVAGYEPKEESLKKIVTNARNSISQIARFKKLVTLFNSRNNGMVGPLMNLLFLYDLYNIIQLERWRRQHHAILLHAIKDVILTDAYVSCATFAFNHPENNYPVFATGNETIRAQNIRHPLLPQTVAVGNDFALGKDENLYLLTGANMTGKSTFMRTVGVNVVLAQTGLPVPADMMELPILQLYTSMRITDSVQEDISYFRAELNRIQTMMQAIADQKHRYLVLLDEPLRGTNSQDKQSGTRAITERMLQENVTGIVATHDTGLSDMAKITGGRVANYHFESAVTETGLSFDFKLKKGVSTSNNATILMQQMGIIN